MTQGFKRVALTSAPPAQQASSDDLLGERGLHDSHDLPLTARMRPLADPIELAAIFAAIAGIAAFGLPFIIQLVR